MPDLRNIIDLTVALSVFGLVLGVWLVVVFLRVLRRSRSAEKLEQRLGLREPKTGTRVLRLWRDGKEATTTVTAQERGRSVRGRLDRLRRGAGWETPLQTILLGLLGVTLLVAVVVVVLTGSWAGGLTSAAVVVVIFWTYVARRINRRRTLFETQFIEAIGLACRSLRAGHPLTGAFRLISEEIAPPVGETFEEVCQQQVLGVSLETAIRNTAVRSDSEDMRMFATSVIMQLRSGGNLADMMERLALVMRDRRRLNRRVRILTAQTQFSKRVLLGLPIGLFAVLNSLNPDYMGPLYTTGAGRVMLGVGVAGLLSGAIIMNRIGKLHY